MLATTVAPEQPIASALAVDVDVDDGPLSLPVASPSSLLNVRDSVINNDNDFPEDEGM